MPITLDDLIAEVQDLAAKRSAAAAAHGETLGASQHLTDETVSAQADIDSANAAYEARTTAARQELASKQGAEDTAEASEQSAFDKLVADLTAFKQDQ